MWISLSSGPVIESFDRSDENSVGYFIDSWPLGHRFVVYYLHTIERLTKTLPFWNMKLRQPCTTKNTYYMQRLWDAEISFVRGPAFGFRFVFTSRCRWFLGFDGYLASLIVDRNSHRQRQPTILNKSQSFIYKCSPIQELRATASESSFSEIWNKLYNKNKTLLCKQPKYRPFE